MRKNRSDAGITTSPQNPKPAYGTGIEVTSQDYAEVYKAARTREATEKARLLSLKNGTLAGELLDSRTCVHEIGMVFISIKEIVLASDALSGSGKQALLNRLVNCAEIELISQPPKPQDPPLPQEKPAGWSDYMFARLREVAARAENFKLKADELESSLLARSFFANEFAQLVKAVKSILQRSRLTPREKADALRNLERIGGVPDSVARTQSKAGAEPATKNGNGNGDSDDS